MRSRILRGEDVNRFLKKLWERVDGGRISSFTVFLTTALLELVSDKRDDSNSERGLNGRNVPSAGPRRGGVPP